MRQDNEQVIFNGDFKREIFAGTGFEPSTFRPTSSGPADFPSLRYRPPSSVLYSWPKLDCHQPLGVRLLGAVASNRLLTRARSTQSVYVQESRCATASLTAPRYKDHQQLHVISLFPTTRSLKKENHLERAGIEPRSYCSTSNLSSHTIIAPQARLG